MDPKHSIGPDRIDYKETPGDLTEVHAAIERENPEPTADVTPIPLWLTGVCGFAIACAGMYLGIFHGGFRGDVFNERSSSPSQLFAEPKGAKKAEAAGPKSLAEQGKSVYSTICQACHQAGGVGTPGVFPPLAKSEWVTGSEKRLVAIILKGLQGPITVEGKQYANVMPPQGPALNDEKIAAVASYVRANFGNNAPEITPGKVAAARKEFESKADAFTEATLNQIPADATLTDAGGPAPAAAPAAAQPGAALTPDEVKKLMAVGKTQYMTICVACHQPTGAGLPGVFPPLIKNEYILGSAERLAGMVLKGIVGPITVDGKPYSNIMPGQEAVLADDKIAAALTFARASFGNTAPPVAPAVVTAARKKFADRKTPWTEAELKAWKE